MMQTFTICIYITICVIYNVICSQDDDDGKIIGGVRVSIKEVPFMALYRPANVKYHCGASIIGSQFLVSAAHCYRSSDMDVTVGTDLAESGGERYEIEKTVIHPLYEKTDYPYDYDVLVIKLKKRLTFSDRVAPVNMATSDLILDDNAIFSACGFGLTSPRLRIIYSNQLLGVDLPHVNLEICRRQLANYFRISDRMICAGGERNKDSCQSDSGGPLYHRSGNVLVGIVSFGEGCGRDLPAVYTRISAVRDFIDSVIHENSGLPFQPMDVHCWT